MLLPRKATASAIAVDECRFGAFGELVQKNGFSPIPIARGKKQTWLRNWSKWCRYAPSPEIVAAWAANYPDDGLALACGNILVIDIDETDQVRAAELKASTIATLGATPFERVGNAPKVALFYRVASPAGIASMKIGRVDLLANGRYVVAFGIHPETGRSYRWAGPTPATMPLSELPVADPFALSDLIEKFRVFYNIDTSPAENEKRKGGTSSPAKSAIRRPQADSRWVIDDCNRVIDGRDVYLATRVYAAFASGLTTVNEIAASAWSSFAAGADLARPKRDGKRPWTIKDAKQKASALLRSGKSRPTGTIGDTSSFWTPSCRQAFLHAVDRDGANGLLGPATVAVSRTMLAYASSRSGTCFASTLRLAAQLKLSVDTVKKARRLLRQKGYWLAFEPVGGRGRTAHYVPNPDVLMWPDPFARTVTANAIGSMAPNIMMIKTVDDLSTQNNQGEGDHILPPATTTHADENAFIGLEEAKKEAAVSQSFFSYLPASADCRDVRSSSAVKSVAKVPWP